jgi:tellurite resistance protein
MQEVNHLENFPISFFATVMGLAGLTIAWEKIQHVLHIDPWLVGATAILFVVLSLLYASKLVRYRGEVIKELRNPIKLNFFPAMLLFQSPAISD